MTRPVWAWLEASVVSGDVLDAGGDAYRHLAYFVRADRDGPMTRRLLGYVTDRRPVARRRVLTVLNRLCDGSGWPLAADAAEQALHDPDMEVRRSAATLLAGTADAGRAASVLSGSADPVVRVVLTGAVPWHRVRQGDVLLRRLRSDPVAGVRVAAGLASYRAGDAAARPGLDAGVRAGLAVQGRAGRVAAGARIARALERLDREDDCCSWALDLAATPGFERAAVAMAVAAMRAWRASPARMVAALAGMLDGDAGRVALRAITASLTASRLAADELAARLDVPRAARRAGARLDVFRGAGEVAARLDLPGAVGEAGARLDLSRDAGAPGARLDVARAAVALGCAGDLRAVPYLVRLLSAGSGEPRLAEAFRAVARAGVDPYAPVDAARRILASAPDGCEPEAPMRVLAAFGPAAAAAVPELVARLRGVENDTPDLTFHVLRCIGPAAAAAGGELRDFPTVGARLALLAVSGDRSVADRYLAGLPEQPGGAAAPVLVWVARHGGLTARQHRQALHLLRAPAPARPGVGSGPPGWGSASPGWGSARSATESVRLGSGSVRPGTESVRLAAAEALWWHAGPAVAALLLEVVPAYLADPRHVDGAVRLLGEMGAHARPVAGRLALVAAGRRRMAFGDGSRGGGGGADAAMRADERLLVAVGDVCRYVGRV